MNLSYYRFLLVMTISLFSGIWPAQAQQNRNFDKAWKETNTYFRNTLKENQIVGGALLFLEKGQIKGASYYGKAAISEERAVDENTDFPLGFHYQNIYSHRHDATPRPRFTHPA